MSFLKRVLKHLARLLLLLFPSVATTVIAGLLVTNRAAQSPIEHTLLAVLVMFPVLMALVAVPSFVTRFLCELYSIRSREDGFSFLSRLLFGSCEFGPFLIIKEGKIASGERSILHKVGGPGALVIYNDTAVVTERCGRLCRVLGPGLGSPFPQMGPFEKVWEIVDLRPQRWVYEVSAMTRDGIPVVCEADVSFKIDDRFTDENGHVQVKQPTEKEPYPCTAEAVLRAATSRWIRDPDWDKWPMDWAGRVVIGFTEGTLRDILAEYMLDWLLAPARQGAETPREIIRKRLEDELRKKAERVGAKIIGVDLGEIWVKRAEKVGEPEHKGEDDRVPRQWVEAWQADWEAQALTRRMEGEAEILRLQTAQAQAQAEMLITLTEHLQSVINTEGELRTYLLAARFVQALRWMSFDPYLRAYMPPEAIQTLKRLQDALDEERRLPGEGVSEKGQAKEAR